jgi:centriolar protein POC1
LLSAAADSTIKIWDLRQGHILYSLYGHEGAATSCSFSPGGDFFTSSGADSVVMVWKSNLNEIETETLDTTSGLARAKTGAAQKSAVGGAGTRPAS